MTATERNAMRNERAELLKERAEIVARLAQPKADQRRLEEIDNEIARLNQPDHGVELVCLGKRVGDSQRDFATVVVRDNSIVALPPMYQFHEGSKEEVGVSQDDYLKAAQRGRVLHGGRENVVSKDLAKRLIEAGCHVTPRAAVPIVTYGSRQYLTANPTV